MDKLRFINKTSGHNDDTRSKFLSGRKLFWSWSSESHCDTKNDNYNKRNRYNKYIPTVIAAVLGMNSLPTMAETVGGVSATASPIANSSGSVTNQAIQVLQGPYITNTYGGGIQCQGPTMNVTPFVTGNVTWKKPFERYYDDPVYDVHDADDDGQIDNPGEVLYYVPTRTGQTDNYNLSVGVSATWSKPLDKDLQELCKNAAEIQMAAVEQNTANKRLDFEIARLKNCGELMKAGIVFVPGTKYAKVCEDVMLVNPPGVVAEHTHVLSQQPTVTLEEVDLSSDDKHSHEQGHEKDDQGSSRRWFEFWKSPSSQQVSLPSESSQLEVLQIGQMSLQ